MVRDESRYDDRATAEAARDAAPRAKERRTGVPGRLPASFGSACCPTRRGAALPAEGPLRRRDGGRGDGRGRFAARRGRVSGAFAGTHPPPG